MGEIFFRGNLVMKGYLKNALATEEALRWRLVPPAIWR
jgi:long-subunit acyl-CoA synthetase (AMP-forming)